MISSKFGRGVALFMALALVLALALTACGDATNTPAPATTAAATTAATTAAPATTAKAATTAAAVTTAAATTAAPGFSVVNTKVAANLKTGPGVDTATKTIKVGTLFPLTGPVGPYGKIQLSGVETYFKALNDAGARNVYTHQRSGYFAITYRLESPPGTSA